MMRCVRGCLVTTTTIQEDAAHNQPTSLGKPPYAHRMSGTLIAARHAALGATAAAPLLALKLGSRVQRVVLQKG